MTYEVFEDLEQGSDGWHLARAQIPTASMFSAVMAKGAGKTRLTYMYKLAGEVITGQPVESFQSAAMARGHVMEEVARKLYEFESDNEVVQVGFIKNAERNYGCSPDGLIGDKGMIEIKSHAPHILIPILFAGEMPSTHNAQVQGQMLVAEREWCDFVACYTGMPMMTKRVYRDDSYIKSLRVELQLFNEQLNELVEKIRSY